MITVGLTARAHYLL